MSRHSRAPRVGVRHTVKIGWWAYRLWDRQDCIDLSAAFAYHSLQSFFPVLLIALGVASRLLGRQDGLVDEILAWADQVLPPAVLPLVGSTLAKLVRQGVGAGVVGVLFLLVTASNAYLSLHRGADRLWGFRPVPVQPLPWSVLIWRFVRLRAKAFGLVLLIGLLIVLDQLLTTFRFLSAGTWRAALSDWLPPGLQLWVPLPVVVDLLLSLVIAWLLALALLWVLPSRPIPLRPLIPGALLIGTALTGLNLALGRSLLSLSNRFQAYGVIGGVLVLTLWVWLVGLIVYYGMAVSVVLSRQGVGGRSTPWSVGAEPPGAAG